MDLAGSEKASWGAMCGPMLVGVGAVSVFGWVVVVVVAAAAVVLVFLEGKDGNSSFLGLSCFL